MNKSKNIFGYKRQEVNLNKVYPIISPGRILIKKDLVEETAKNSKIILAKEAIEEAEEFATKGTVVSFGKLEKELLIDCPVTPGSRVAFGKYSGTEFTWGDEDFVIIRHDEIFASWEPDVKE